MKFSMLVNNYGKLWQLGVQIIKNRNKLRTLKHPRLIEQTHSQQHNMIEEFEKLATKTTIDQKKYKNNINKFWTGLS